MDSTYQHYKTEKIFRWVDELYPMEKGAFITHPNEGFRFANYFIGRRQIKHIIEQRKAEGKSVNEIKLILGLLPEAVLDYDFESPNRNKKYPNSVLRYKVFDEFSWGVVAVLDQSVASRQVVITAYRSSMKNIYQNKKKLHTTAAGETPHS